MVQVAPREKESSATVLDMFRLGRAFTQRNPWRTILPGCSPQLVGGHLLNLPLPREVGSGSTAALDLPVPSHTAKESVGAPGDPYAPYDNL